LAARNIAKAKILEIDGLPLLALTVTRLLEAFVLCLQLDHKSASLALRDALMAQSQSSKQGASSDLTWYFSTLMVLYHNLACVSLSLHLRTEAAGYIQKAEQVLRQTPCSSTALEAKVVRFRMQMVPREDDDLQWVEPAEQTPQPPFLPGGHFGDPSKLVELTKEATPRFEERKTARKLPKRLALQQLFSKDNPYVQHIASVKSSRRYHSVQPSLRFPSNCPV